MPVPPPSGLVAARAAARAAAWALAALLVSAGPAWGQSPSRPAASDECLSFVGDVSLSRRVAQVVDTPDLWRELWAGLALGAGPVATGDARGRERSLQALVGNLEGALQLDASARCRNPFGLCLPILPSHLSALARTPFVALSLENNHSLDYDAAARVELQRRLATLGIAPLTDGETEPFTLLQRGQTTWALVALNLINRPADEVDEALLRVRLRIGLARAHTPSVAVLVHWGREYDPQAGPLEAKLGPLFAAWGAQLIVGAHPHVVGDVRCQPDHAMYYSLGNLLFDQPQPETGRGALLRCCPQAQTGLDCRLFQTRRRAATPTQPLLALLPELTGELPAGHCQISVAAPSKSQPTALPSPRGPDTAWQRHPGRAALRFVQPFRSLGPGHYFALRRLYSTFDGETALRPYVFAVRGDRPLDRWRGTALSFPLLYARLFDAPDGRELLCALHRGDSFMHRNPGVGRERRFHAVYAWTGFGFRQVEDAAALAVCQRL